MDHNEELVQLMNKTPEDGVKVRGFYRVQLTEPGDEFAVASDSGWLENQITNLGFLNLVKLLAGSAGSSTVSHLALGSGGAPASNATSLEGEVEVRAAVTAASNGSTALQLTATFASSDNFVTNTQNISNIGCFATSTQTQGTLLAGNTYASSSCATNQNVNATYTWTFS